MNSSRFEDPIEAGEKLNSRSLPWPTDWRALFGTERPLILEIGFGYGHYLVHLARTYPDHHVIGLEISNRCLSKVERWVKRAHLSSVRLIHSTAETALAHLFTPASLTQVHINFPDPWFKSRHEHRRLMQRDTLDVLVNRLAPDGLLYLATDISEYAEMSAELLAETPGLDNLYETPWVHQMPGRVMTKYERKAIAEGRPCYYFAYRRNQQPAHVIVEGRELIMPHVVLETPLSLEMLYERFQPFEYNENEMHIHFMQVFRGDHSLLFEVFVKEVTIEQRVALVLLQRQDHPTELTLQLSTLGYPRPTIGIHKAVSLLSKWLVDSHPETRVIKHTVQSELVNFVG